MDKEVRRVRARKPQKEEKGAAVPKEMDMEERLLGQFVSGDFILPCLI